MRIYLNKAVWKRRNQLEERKGKAAEKIAENEVTTAKCILYNSLTDLLTIPLR